MHNGRREPRRMRYSLESRLRIARLIEDGERPADAAAALGASRASGYRIWRRYRDEGWQGLCDRPSTPKRQPRRMSVAEEARIVALRRELGVGAQVIAVIVGRPPSTVGKVLRRAGCSRLPRPERVVRPRYERDRPGELVHVDVKKLGRFWEVGKRIRQDGVQRNRRAGWSYLHVAIDDHTRLVYAELLNDERGPSCAAFLRRATAWYAERGITLERVLSDNAKAYHGTPLAHGLQRTGHRPPLHPSLQPLDKRQGRSADQNDATRMGLPLRLPNQ
jgi:transposase